MAMIDRMALDLYETHLNRTRQKVALLEKLDPNPPQGYREMIERHSYLVALSHAGGLTVEELREKSELESRINGWLERGFSQPEQTQDLPIGAK